jgi:hypothetical protein
MRYPIALVVRLFALVEGHPDHANTPFSAMPW